MHNFSFINFINGPYFFSYNTNTVGFISDDMYSWFPRWRSLLQSLSSKITDHGQFLKNYNFITTFEILLHQEE